MAGNLGELTVRLGLDSSGLSGGLRTAASALTGFASSAPALLNPVAIAGAAIGLVAVGVGVASTKMAADFQQGLTLLNTSAGESKDKLQMVGDGILDIATQTGTSTDQLLKGMFNIESAGYHGTDALKLEAAAAMGARVENSDLAATTDVLTTTMHNYHETASQAVDTMNSFRMAASLGKMHMDDLTGALRNVLPIASQAGVHLTDVEAAIATMSNSGDKGAAAGTHLSQMLTYLLAPSSKATKALQSVGLTTQEISDEMKVSLPGAVEMITQAVGEKFPVGSAKYIAAISAIVGGNKSMKAMLELSGGSFKEFASDAANLAPTMKSASTSIDGFAAVQGNMNFQMDRAKEAIAVLGIKLGTALLPSLTMIVGKGADLIVSFTQWEVKTHGVENAIGALGQVFNNVGSFMGKVGGILHQVGDAFNAVFFPVKQVTQAVKPLTDVFDRATAVFHTTTIAVKPLTDTFDRSTVVIHSVNTAVKPLTDTFDRATAVFHTTATGAHTVTEAVNPFIPIFRNVATVLSVVWSNLQPVGAFLVATFVPVWQQLVTTFQSQLLPAWNDLVKAIQPLMPELQMAAQFVGGILVVSLVILVGVIAGVVRAFAGFISGIAFAFGGIVEIISGAVQTISGIIALMVDIVTGKWSKLGTDLATIGGGIGRMFVGLWHTFQGIFQAGINVVVGFVSGFFTTVVGIFTHLWDVLVGHSIIPDTVNDIVSWIAQLPGRAIAYIVNMAEQFILRFQMLKAQAEFTVSAMINSLLGRLNNFAGSMFGIGRNIIQGIINGISSMIGNVSNAIGNIVNVIDSHLPHSPAKTGPLSQLNKYGPALVTGIATGIDKSHDVIETSVRHMVAPLSMPYPIRPSAIAVAASVNGASSSTAANSTQQTFIFEIDGHQMAQIVNKHTDNYVKLKLGHRSIRAA